MRGQVERTHPVLQEVVEQRGLVREALLPRVREPGPEALGEAENPAHGGRCAADSDDERCRQTRVKTTTWISCSLSSALPHHSRAAHREGDGDREAPPRGPEARASGMVHLRLREQRVLPERGRGASDLVARPFPGCPPNNDTTTVF
eukprot:31191-Pelagococcus_subviridis.AAC.15